MPNLDITKAQVSDYDQITEYQPGFSDTDGVTDQDEQEHTNPRWQIQWNYFTNVAELHNALLMKGYWNTGKGWTADDNTTAMLEDVTGWGTDTFDDIMLNMDVMSMVAANSFSHIVRNPDNPKKILNLKPLNPGTIRWYTNKEGRITRYEQFTRTKKGEKKTFRTFRPDEIFHISNNRMADNMGGLSVIDVLEPIIKADEEMFEITRKVMRQQAIPFIIFKYKTDKTATIEAIIEKIRKIREKYDDLHIPDDENILSWEPVQISPSQLIMTWRDDLRNKFYRAIGLPQIVPGGSVGAADSDSRVIYLAFEQLVTQRQRFLQNQIKRQLGLDVRFNPPTTMADLIGKDENKDGQAPFNTQAGELNAAGAQQ